MKKLLFITLLAFLICSCNSTTPNSGGQGSDPGGGQGLDPGTDPGTEDPKELSNVLNEPYIGNQYYLNHIGDIYSVWGKYRGKGVTVAVIDKAFHAYHEDFYDEKGELQISTKSAAFINNNGTITTQVGVSYVNDLSDSHGTFCAGIVGARTNKKGVVGIAPDCDLMLLKVDGKPKSIVEAFRYAADHGAKVITISIGSYYNYDGDLINDGSDLGQVFSSSLKYCHDKGVVVCSAAGNGGGDSSTVHEYTFPGACDYVIGCGGLAFNSNENVWSGSSYNSSSSYQFVDIFAPSEKMFGCSNYTDNTGTYRQYDGGWEGTSFSSPIVAGLAALYFEKYPTRTVVEFEKDLYASCHKLSNSSIGEVDQLGYGRVDAGKLLDEVNTQQVTLKVKSNYSSLNVYAWNSDLSKNKELANWPGKQMNKSDGYFTYTFKLSDYDSLIFNNGSNQTIDISASSFIYDNAYDITALKKEGNLIVGSYIEV